MGKVVVVTVLREESTAELKLGRHPRKSSAGSRQGPARAAVQTAAGGNTRRCGAVQAGRGRGIVPPSPRVYPREAFVPLPARGRERAMAVSSRGRGAVLSGGRSVPWVRAGATQPVGAKNKSVFRRRVQPLSRGAGSGVSVAERPRAGLPDLSHGWGTLADGSGLWPPWCSWVCWASRPGRQCWFCVPLTHIAPHDQRQALEVASRAPCTVCVSLPRGRSFRHGGQEPRAPLCPPSLSLGDCVTSGCPHTRACALQLVRPIGPVRATC